LIKNNLAKELISSEFGQMYEQSIYWPNGFQPKDTDTTLWLALHFFGQKTFGQMTFGRHVCDPVIWPNF
jgi:hypothetical protein